MDKGWTLVTKEGTKESVNLNTFDFMESIMLFHIMILFTIMFTYYAILCEVKKKGKTIIQIEGALSILLFCIGVGLIRNDTMLAIEMSKFQRVGFLLFLLVLSRITLSNMLDLSKKGLEVDAFKKIAFENELTRLGNKKKFEKTILDIEQ